MQQQNFSKSERVFDLEVEVSPILVVNNPKFKPYIEQFSFEPANMVQEPLGKLLGFFKINDLSEDSAYIVNFLSSVVRKEYYINPKRPVEASFDSALHKTNVALSELAKNGNIDWIGNLDSAVCAMVRNNFYFSVTGNAKIFLLRDNVISEISEGLSEKNTDPHPIKTYTNVSNGPLFKNDKIIITSDDIFSVFSLVEIKKNAVRLPPRKFSQFIHTALVNELESAETIIIDVSEKPKEVEELEEKNEEKEKLFTNAFSAQSFAKPLPPKQEYRETPEIKESPREFIDEKTGHIYVQEDQKFEVRSDKARIFWFIVREKVKEFGLWLKDKIKKRGKIKIEKEPQATTASLRKRAISFTSYLSTLTSKISGAAKSWRFKINLLSPSFPRLREVFKRLTAKEKIVGISIILLVIFIPLAVMRFSNRENSTPTLTAPEQPVDRKDTLAGEKNIKLDTETQMIFDGSEAIASEILKDEVFIITADKVIAHEKDGKLNDYSLGSELGKITKSTSMEDLNMILLLTDKSKIISFSPASRDFKENSAAIKENENICCLATYLTYLYLVGENGIYRYPRAEGGFGPPVSWLKEEINLKEIKDIAIDENIYLVLEKGVAKFFQGKNAEFNIESSQTAINFSRLYTAREFSNLYVLDSSNGRIVRFSKNGEILAQYYNDILVGAKDLAVDEGNSEAVFVTESGGVVKIKLQPVI